MKKDIEMESEERDTEKESEEGDIKRVLEILV